MSARREAIPDWGRIFVRTRARYSSRESEERTALRTMSSFYKDPGTSEFPANSTVAVSGGGKTMADKPTLSNEVQNQWARIRGRLRGEVGDAAYRNWIKPITLIEMGGGRVRVALPTKFLRDWVAANYADRIRSLWNAENAAILMVEVVVIASLQDYAIARREPEPEAAKNGGDERVEISAPL